MHPGKKVQPPPPSRVVKVCPGITAAYDSRVSLYLAASGVTGGGGRSITTLSEEQYGVPYRDLGPERQAAICTAQFHTRTWRNDTTVNVMAVFACRKLPCKAMFEVDTKDLSIPMPCGSCILIHSSRAFENTLARDWKTIAEDQDKTQKYTPGIFRNETQGKIFARRKGVEKLFEEVRSEDSVLMRYVSHVLSGHFKDSQVFMGLVEAMTAAKDREIRGVRMQNFKYNTDYREFMALVNTISSRASRTIAQEFKVETSRSMKGQEAAKPRFPIGIEDRTFEFAKQYCDEYHYPHNFPLGLSVDDTKVFASLQPLHDRGAGKKGEWYLLGGIDDNTKIRIPDIEALETFLNDQTIPKATKIRLWVLQIPLPVVPPLALAILPIGSTIKGPELAKHQTMLMKGLIAQGLRIISNASDGAAVEQDCQHRLAAAGQENREYLIQPPTPDYSPISVPLLSLDGNIFVNIQDSKHGLKTFHNNIFTGARVVTLGNFLVYYEQIRDIAVDKSGPLYERDVIRYDKQDDNAASRLFSSELLCHASQDPKRNLGVVVYTFVFGEFIDAYQSRTMSHKERAKISIRTLLFMETWQHFLKKQGYSQAQHFISSQAYDIAKTLATGLLGVMVIYRDHLPRPVPLLTWKLCSDGNERTFSGMRGLIPDFSVVQAIIMAPKLRLMIRANFKKTANGYQHTFMLDGELDYELLKCFPSDIDFTEAYRLALEENETLWTLLGLHPSIIEGAPAPSLESLPVSSDPLPDVEIDDQEPPSNETILEGLQNAIDSINSATNLTLAEENELEALTFAAVALSVEKLARMYVTIASLGSSTDTAEQIKADVQRAIAVNPQLVSAVLQNLLDNTTLETEGPPCSVIEVTPSELEPLISIRQSHQTVQAMKGVRTYKPPMAQQQRPKTKPDDTPKEISKEQELAQRINSIIHRAQDWGSSTGLNRKMRWTGESSNAPAANSGNTANAEVAAKGRASEVSSLGGSETQALTKSYK
ncbi:hypothetical protein ARMSODRAFT_894015 [Armillaria solidipes]|uniref:Uncharacterized protein n=1 Tax=Armillaria solidipes TaxID=1076256 RepID=A0A2H3AY35_9AGAR|nr:hypothetical protein ARMSODRAFT_894015 [Armillaria solidipes]